MTDPDISPRPPDDDPFDETVLVRHASALPAEDTLLSRVLSVPTEPLDDATSIAHRGQGGPWAQTDAVDETVIAARPPIGRHAAAEPALDETLPAVPDRIVPARTAHVPADADVAARTVHGREAPAQVARAHRASPPSLPAADHAAVERAHRSRERRRLAALVVVAAALVVAGAAGLLLLLL